MFICSVLIESDWNLKLMLSEALMRYSLVLIESDWNLKTPWEIEVLREAAVLIESDWNLKLFVRFYRTVLFSY